MKGEREEKREKFIESVQEWIKDETGITPSFEQIDGYVGDETGDIKPGAPPWLNIEHKDNNVKLN
jgi:hypothetical protein